MLANMEYVSTVSKASETDKDINSSEVSVLSSQAVPESMSSSSNVSSSRSNEEQVRRVESDDWVSVHGFRGSPSWTAPRMTKYCVHEARPGYAAVLAHEYQEESYVLMEKVALLATLIRNARNCILYTGAGLSTAAGIGDYATLDSSGNRVGAAKKIYSPMQAKPTYGHVVLAEMCRQKMVQQWIQQNHDGLPQKAGVPQHLINEIHGAWYDPSNPVVPMSGDLRGDLFEGMLRWEEATDLTISLGTSMCGMNSDRVFTTVASRAKQQNAIDIAPGVYLGGVIIGIQQTQYDHLACLRIFSRIDEVMRLLAPMLELSVPDTLDGITWPKLRLQAELMLPRNTTKFLVYYDSRGKRSDSQSVLDLSPDAKVRLVSGPYRGDIGTVMEQSSEGHYRIQFHHILSKKTQVRKPFVRVLGWWWVEAATKGTVPTIPVVNTK